MISDIVVSLEATDDFICEKAMRQPEGDSRLDEEVVLKRLSEFRSGDARDVTPLNFFDELDIHPLVVPVKDNLDYSMTGSYAAVALRMGRPCRYAKLLGKFCSKEFGFYQVLMASKTNIVFLKKLSLKLLKREKRKILRLCAVKKKKRFRN